MEPVLCDTDGMRSRKLDFFHRFSVNSKVMFAKSANYTPVGNFNYTISSYKTLNIAGSGLNLSDPYGVVN